MSSLPGSPVVVKGHLVQYDPTGTRPATAFTFPFNPSTLSRTFEFPLSASGTPVAGASPQETIGFTLRLDASDQLELGQPPLVYPGLAALEVLMRPPAPGSRAFLLFTWGSRAAPVRISELKILERLFDPQLNTLQASVRVTLAVLSGPGSSDIGAGGSGAKYEQSVAIAAGLALGPPPPQNPKG